MESTLLEMKEKSSERNSYINSILVSMGNGLVVINEDFNITMLNPEAERLLGVDKKIFFSNYEEIKNDLLESIFKMGKPVLKTRIGTEFVIQNQDMTLEVFIEPMLNKYRPEELYGALIILKDVTKVRKLERQRKEFVSNVSHEIRTPLTLISGFVETLKMWDAIEKQDRMRALDIIELETDRLKRLISELLRLSEIESQLPYEEDTYIDVKSITSEVIRSFQPFVEEKGLEIVENIHLDKNLLIGNENWIRQMISNLIDNGIKYTPSGGVIEIKAYYQEGTLTIEVKDTGIGIPQEDIERIFERFYRVDKARNSKAGGSGIRLAIVKHIVSCFNGSITVKSKEGLGSSFTVSLPINLS